MRECNLLKECRFFNDIFEHMPTISESLKNEYCLGDHTRCARFLIFETIGKEHVPDEIFPHQHEKAAKLIRHFKMHGGHD